MKNTNKTNMRMIKNTFSYVYTANGELILNF